MDDGLALPEDTHHRVELLGGVLLLSPHPDVPHQRAGSRLAVLLDAAIGARAAPFEVLTAINLVVPDGLLIPDLVVADANAAATADLTLHGRDVLIAIEVTTPCTRVADTVLKSAMYAAAGIPHYWRLEQPRTRPWPWLSTRAGRLDEKGAALAATNRPDAHRRLPLREQ